MKATRLGRLSCPASSLLALMRSSAVASYKLLFLRCPRLVSLTFLPPGSTRHVQDTMKTRSDFPKVSWAVCTLQASLHSLFFGSHESFQYWMSFICLILILNTCPQKRTFLDDTEILLVLSFLHDSTILPMSE